MNAQIFRDFGHLQYSRTTFSRKSHDEPLPAIGFLASESNFNRHGLASEADSFEVFSQYPTI
jgi:hypothetical protein